MRSIPAAHALLLQVGKQAIGELLVFARMADKAGIELNGRSHQRTYFLNKAVGNTHASQKFTWDLALRAVNRSNADCRRPKMLYGFNPLYPAQIYMCERGMSYLRHLKLCFVEIRPGEIHPSQVRSAEISCAEVRISEIRPAQICPSEVSSAEVRLAQIRHYVWVAFAPFIPRLDSLLNDLEMFFIGHMH